MTTIADLIGLIGSAGNVAGIQGDNPSGLNALQRMALPPEQQAALYQQTQSASKPINLSDPNLPQETAVNPARAAAVQQFMNTQRMQAMQPLSLASIKNMQTNGSLSDADALGAQALLAAYASNDPKEISTTARSLYEHNPDLAGRIKGEQEGNTLFEMPDGTHVLGKRLGAGANPQATPSPPTGYPKGLPWKSTAKANPTITPQSPSGQDALGTMYNTTPISSNNTSAITDQSSSQSIPLAADGKPLLPNIQTWNAPDPSGMPKYNLTPQSNTKQGISEVQKNTDNASTADFKAHTDMTGQLGSLQQEKYRIQQLMDIYHDVQAGTLVAQSPEFFNKLAAIGDGADLKKDVGNYQAAMQNHIYQLLGQYKDTNTSMGQTTQRMFGSPINTLLEEGENPGKQPGGLYSVLTQALGAVNHHIDMINAWQKVGGLGNRLNADGTTLRPDDFIQRWSIAHDMRDYQKAAEKITKPFVGMPGNEAIPNASSYKTPEDVGNAYKQGKLTKAQAIQLLRQNHGKL